MKNKTKDLYKKIIRNLFINDMHWKERAEDNIKYAREIRECICLGHLDNGIENRKLQVEILNFLEKHNL